MKIFDNQEMKNYSNMRVGGKAKRLIILESKEEIIDVYKNEENTNIFILGNGTNVLFTDDFMDKTFVCTKKLNKIEDLGSNLVRVETGANLKDLTDFMRDKNYSGIESLFGIPGSIGGLVYMNGGAFGTEIFDKIVSIEVFDENHQIREIKKEDLIYILDRWIKFLEKPITDENYEEIFQMEDPVVKVLKDGKYVII